MEATVLSTIRHCPRDHLLKYLVSRQYLKAPPDGRGPCGFAENDGLRADFFLVKGVSMINRLYP